MYKGKEPCQGCGAPGTEKARLTKYNLCLKCQDAFNKYKSNTKEATSMEYVLLYQPRYAVVDVSIRNNQFSLTGAFVRSVLEAFDNKNAKAEDRVASIGSLNTGGTGETYRIPRSVYKALSGAVIVMEEIAASIRKEQDEAHMYTRTQLAKERDRIYNEGVVRGRNLLLQLNSGEITLEQLQQKQSYETDQTTNKQQEK